METSREQSNRHEDEAISIAIISQQITALREVVTVKLENQAQALSQIKEQTTKTNGHVADAFKEIANINAWKNKITGALVISNVIILPILMYIIYQHMQGK